MQLVTNVDSKNLHHHNQDHQQQQYHNQDNQQQKQQHQQQTENKSQETNYDSHHCRPNHHHHHRHHLHQHHHHYQNHHHHHHHHQVDHRHRRPSPPHEDSVSSNTLNSTTEVCQLNQLQNQHHHQHHHHHHHNHCLRSPLPLPPPRHHHHHHHHWSVTMTTVTLLVSILACSLPVATSLEDKDSKLAPPGLKVIMHPVDAHNNHSNNNNNNNNKLTPVEFKNVSSLDNLKFKAVDLQRQQADRQGNVVVQQQQKKEDWQPPSNNQGIPPPVQPSQEHQGKFNNWANPPPPPPQPSLGSEQKNIWSAADKQNAATGASASWRQSWNQEVLTQHQTQPVPDPWVDRESRKGVEWNYNANYYSLKASSDSRFLIRYSPPPTPGSPWPMPQTYKPSSVVLTIDPRVLQFQVTVGQEKYNIPKLHDTQNKEGDDFDDERDYSSCSIVDFNVDRAVKNAFGGLWDKERSRVVADKWSSRHAKDKAKDGGRGASEDSEGNTVKSFIIKVYKPCEEHPHLNMNESYSLMVTSTQVVLVSPEVWGLIRGLETFSQLVYQEEKDPFKFLINMTTIVDFPRFKHRGILLDTSRHYLEVSTILENLESMSQNKYNVFHWHIVDDQSFPFKSYSYPNLTLQGAYDYDTHIYTHEDVELIIEYARLRGIRVIPEFDTPGHTFSWGFGQSHLLTPCHDLSGAFNGLYGPINPILRKNYNFLRNLFKEVMSVFKDKYLHLGGDEVPFDCWMSNPQIRKFMNKNVITDIKQILSFYARQLFSLISNNAKELKRDTGSIVWQEMFDNDVELPKDTIIQVWSGDSYDLERITKMGYATLFSTCWYLDYIQYGQDWDKYYLCEHISNLHLKNESLFYGGEVCLWAEYTDDSDILTRLWPRASAAAERLWSDKSVNNLYRAAPRLEMQRCRMMERGLQVGVLSGPSHCTKFRKKRAQHMADQEGANASPNFPDPEKGDESYPQLENQDKRKLNRYGNSMEFNSRLKSRRHPNERFSNVGVVKQSDSFFGSDFFASSGSISLYVLVCFVFFLVFFFLKKKWVKLPVPTYFLTRNYRAFIVCLIFLTVVFILLQQARFFGKFPKSAAQFGKSGRSG